MAHVHPQWQKNIIEEVASADRQTYLTCGGPHPSSLPNIFLNDEAINFSTAIDFQLLYDVIADSLDDCLKIIEGYNA